LFGLGKHIRVTVLFNSVLLLLIFYFFTMVFFFKVLIVFNFTIQIKFIVFSQ
jgi:hypothetical protein